jgi:hypothetical protein
MHINNNYKIINLRVILLVEWKDKEIVNKCMDKMEGKQGIIDVYHGNNI